MEHPFASTGSYPVRGGNAVGLLVDGNPAFRRLCEAIEGARRSVWATVTFMWPGFLMPDGRGPALEVLAGAARRGVDVRLVFWRPDDETATLRRNAFWGAPEHMGQLEALGAPLGVRWDRAHPGFCQHQKTWLIDTGEPDAVAFVGGINLNPHSLADPGHPAGGQNHDAYLELRGPAVADVEHNFVQRWNEASERHVPGGAWGEPEPRDLRFPADAPPPAGSVVVQVQRTTHAGRYRDGHAAVGGRPYDVAAGETTVLDQYLLAIRAARRTIYLENQYLEVDGVVEALHDALSRGVAVTMLMPAVPELSPAAYGSPERRAFHARRAALGRHEGFALCGIAGLGPDGRRTPVYVHSKLMLVDDAWATVGSANLHRYSLLGNGEMNVSLFSPADVRAFRVALFAEHLGLDTSGLDDVEAARAFRRVASRNRELWDAGDHAWQGLAFELDVATYGLGPGPF